MFEHDDDALETVALDEPMSLGESRFDVSFSSFVGSYISSFPGMSIPAHCRTHGCFPVPIENCYNYLVLYCRVWVVKNSITPSVYWNHH